MLIEIYRVAPGKHEEFLRHLALLDQANAEAGLPPRQLFVHQGGASWDFVLLQPAHHTDEENAKLDAAFKKLGIPQGAKFFVTSGSSSPSTPTRSWRRPRRPST